jgi:hypothetical protein
METVPVQTTKFLVPKTIEIDEIELHLCNGYNAFGHIYINGEKFTIIYIEEESGEIIPKIFACHYYISHKDLMSYYNLLLNNSIIK